MNDGRLGAVEARFADLIWAEEPITTAQLVKRCGEDFQWKRTTTYTVLKRLWERGIFQNRDSVVTSLISREDFYALRTRKFVEETFDGSLPAFLAAFTARQRLSREEVEEIRRMIDTWGEEEQQ